MTDAKGLSEVHRYGVYPVNRGSVAQTKPERDGAYVLYADYTALAQRLKASEAEGGIDYMLAYDEMRQERDALVAKLAACEAERDRLRAALSKAAHELNAIRARDGAPQHIDWDRGRPFQMNGCDPEYFSQLVDECQVALREPNSNQ